MGTEKITVDLSKRRTEPEWNETIDAFVLKSTEIWFRWLSWGLLLGALQYFNSKAKSLLLVTAIGLSVGWLWLYFQAFFYRIEFHGLPWIKSPQQRRVISLILSAGLAFGVWEWMGALAALASASR